MGFRVHHAQHYASQATPLKEVNWQLHGCWATAGLIVRPLQKAGAEFSCRNTALIVCTIRKAEKGCCSHLVDDFSCKAAGWILTPNVRWHQWHWYELLGGVLVQITNA